MRTRLDALCTPRWEHEEQLSVERDYGYWPDPSPSSVDSTYGPNPKEV